MRKKLRVAAYAVCVQDGQLLLARSPAPSGGHEWVLPGGGIDHGEHPNDAVVRELEEETGYHIEVTGFLGMDSIHHVIPWSYRRKVDHHGLRLVYEGRILGGELRDEIGGSTDMAAWHPLDDVPDLRRVPLIDIALRLWRERPAVGRVERVPE